MWSNIPQYLYCECNTTFFCGTTDELRPKATYPFIFSITHTHTHTHTHSVGLLWTFDQLVTEAATCTTQTQAMNIRAFSGIRPSDSSIQAASALRLRLHDYQDMLYYFTPQICFHCAVFCSAGNNQNKTNQSPFTPKLQS